jgi:hypothetical protein
MLTTKSIASSRSNRQPSGLADTVFQLLDGTLAPQIRKNMGHWTARLELAERVKANTLADFICNPPVLIILDYAGPRVVSQKPVLKRSPAFLGSSRITSPTRQ